jgi:hypothetical protein
MAEYLTPQEVRTRIVAGLMSLAADFSRAVDDWEKAVSDGEIKRPDILLNIKMGEDAIKATLPRLLREVKGKVEDAENGVLRYRNNKTRKAD